jgi:hypothetical protein
MTHPLADALLAVLEQVDSMGGCSANGQAYWIADPQGPGQAARVMLSVRFAKKAKTTAHQDLAVRHGTTLIHTLLGAITAAMEALPSVGGAGFQWVFTVHDNGNVRKLALRYGTQAIATGKKATIAAAIHRMVDVLAKLPAHQGRVFAVGNQRFPAAGPQEAFALWTAIQHAGRIDADTMEETSSDLKQTSLMEVVSVDSDFVQRASTMPWIETT